MPKRLRPLGVCSVLAWPFAAFYSSLPRLWRKPSARSETQFKAKPSPSIVNAPSHPFPHYWERMFGSGRAILSLRDSYRRDLARSSRPPASNTSASTPFSTTKSACTTKMPTDNPVYNFSYVDQIYDGLLQNGVRPFVELKLHAREAGGAARSCRIVLVPPDRLATEGLGRNGATLVSHFAQHLVDRYGIDEVSQWYFEVWNEPNLDFWAGDPQRRNLRPALRYDGARAKKRESAPARRRSRHRASRLGRSLYRSRRARTTFPSISYPRTSMATTRRRMFSAPTKRFREHRWFAAPCRKSTTRCGLPPGPALPLIWSEYNASYKNEPAVTDAPFMAPWLADTIRQCDGLVDILAYWAFSDVFEEQGVVKQPFYGGYGLIAEDGLPKPAFNAFKLLHRLGDQRIEVPRIPHWSRGGRRHTRGRGLEPVSPRASRRCPRT